MNDDRKSVRSLLEKSGRAAAPANASDGDIEAEYSAYAQGRISRHSQSTLMFRMADGSVRAFAYSYFYGAESVDPAEGFTLDFSQNKVTIRGRNLETLLRLICQHRVAEVREAGRSQGLAAEADAAIVERIEVDKAATQK